MSKQLRTIRCFSKEEKLQNVFRSFVRVLTQFSQTGLKQDWVYSDQGPLDVHILDLDDESSWQLFSEKTDMIVIAISSHPEFLAGQKYSLSKPLRSQSLLQVLLNIESTEKIQPSMDRTADRPILTGMESPADERLSGMKDSAPTADVLFKLQAWPDLTLMPEEKMLDAARVCSLIAVRPASLDFLEDFLAIPRTELEHVMALIGQCAHNAYPALAEAPSLASTAGAGPAAESKSTAKPSTFLSKIWNRLKGAA